MTDSDLRGAFPALLRFWRSTRGMSQLDLAVNAEVSTKHLSFLETGRARPSRDMVLRLASTLGVPLRDQNTLLLAAGFSAAFRAADQASFDPKIAQALDTMMAHHEPFPLVVLDHGYDLTMANRGAQRLLGAMLGPAALAERNVMKLLFDPSLLRPHVVGWEEVARQMLNRLHREALFRRRDELLPQLISALCRYPDVPSRWHAPDFEAPSEPLLTVAFDVHGTIATFLTTLTVFQAPQNVALEELQIESYFPADAATRELCIALAGSQHRSTDDEP